MKHVQLGNNLHNKVEPPNVTIIWRQSLKQFFEHNKPFMLKNCVNVPNPHCFWNFVFTAGALKQQKQAFMKHVQLGNNLHNKLESPATRIPQCFIDGVPSLERGFHHGRGPNNGKTKSVYNGV